MKIKVISNTPDVMGGTPVFSGTRVPVQTFIEYIEGGHTTKDFLEGFPTVQKTQIIAYLKNLKKILKKAS